MEGKQPINKGGLVALAVIAILALGGAVFAYQKHQQHLTEVAAARHVAQAKADALGRASSRFAELKSGLDSATETYNRHYNAAQAAGDERHKKGAANDLSNDDGLALANKEKTGVKQMQDDESAMYGRLSDMAGVISDAYGESAAHQLRGDAERWNTSAVIALSKWGRAIGDIADSFEDRENGGWGITGSNVEQFYQESDEEETRANSVFQDVYRQVQAFQKRLSSDTGRARAAVAQIK
jgi:hypothetical protein